MNATTRVDLTVTEKTSFLPYSVRERVVRCVGAGPVFWTTVRETTERQIRNSLLPFDNSSKIAVHNTFRVRLNTHYSVRSNNRFQGYSIHSEIFGYTITPGFFLICISRQCAFSLRHANIPHFSTPEISHVTGYRCQRIPDGVRGNMTVLLRLCSRHAPSLPNVTKQRGLFPCLEVVPSWHPLV